MNNFSIAYQILSDCIFQCPICNRWCDKNEVRLNKTQREEMVNFLISKGLKRFTITGGEPMLIKDETIDLIKFLNKNKVHSCLSTTGYNIDKEDIIELENYLDQILLSYPTNNITKWLKHYGNTAKSKLLYLKVHELIGYVKNTEIILEASTVLTKMNCDSIISIGSELAEMNPDIIWRIEYYYPIGNKLSNRNNFELNKDEIFEIH